MRVTLDHPWRRDESEDGQPPAALAGSGWARPTSTCSRSCASWTSLSPIAQRPEGVHSRHYVSTASTKAMRIFGAGSSIPNPCRMVLIPGEQLRRDHVRRDVAEQHLTTIGATHSAMQSLGRQQDPRHLRDHILIAGRLVGLMRDSYPSTKIIESRLAARGQRQADGRIGQTTGESRQGHEEHCHRSGRTATDDR